MIDRREHGLGQLGPLLRQILSYDESLPELEIRTQLAGTVAEHVPGARRCIEGSRFQVHVPQPVIAAFEGKAEAFFTELKGAFVFADVFGHLLGQRFGTAASEQ